MEKLISDINTDSVLAAFSKYPYLSWTDFRDKKIFTGIVSRSERAVKLHATIELLLKGGFIEEVQEYSYHKCRITDKGINRIKTYPLQEIINETRLLDSFLIWPRVSIVTVLLASTVSILLWSC